MSLLCWRLWLVKCLISSTCDVSVPTNVIIGISVGSAVLFLAVLSMAGLFMVTCMCIKKKRKINGHNTGMLAKGH